MFVKDHVISKNQDSNPIATFSRSQKSTGFSALNSNTTRGVFKTLSNI